MRRLYILRHAESNSLPGVDDKDRPLTPAGKVHARALSETAAAKGYVPASILCSSARRTKETACIVCEGLKINYEDSLYLASAGHLYETLKNTSDDNESVMLVGHNPGVHALVRLLTGSGDPTLIEEIAGSYKPGCLSVIDCNCERWADLMPGQNRLIDLLIGKGSS